ncbi:MAG TPA: hypothetical protein VLG66_15895 [Alphaproteobacteria bacterium]|jgi:hypothetical protein|nr:hypothetical protein [Alphaproteobacteria bacterium]
MLRSLILAAVLVAFATGSALAGQCPGDMRKIDEALAKNPQLAADQLAKVKQLRTEGEGLHKAATHAQSIAKLGEAKKILGIQ